MHKGFFSIFLLSTLLFGFIKPSVAYEVVEGEKLETIKVESSQKELTSVEDDCEDCQGKECSKQTGCCFNRCSPSPVGLLPFERLTLENSSKKMGMVIVLAIKKYQSPWIDPALKPPKFS